MKQQSKVKSHSTANKAKKQPATGTSGGKNGGYKWILAAILVLTAIVYSGAINNGFINWDEDDYIVNNQLIRSFNLGAIFTNYLSGNYHPFTELFLAVQYHLWGLKESGYHIVSLLLHMGNTVFVFYLILYLFKRKEVAAVTALLFGVHPMHVESVAWAAEQKDLLYTFFFLASCLFYIRFTISAKRSLYLFSLLFFLFSLLSKAMAACLPVVLLLIDYYTGEKITVKALLQKTPFFVLALIFGAVAVVAQRSIGGIQEVAIYPLYQRILFASYGFLTYLYKLLLPVNLSAFYPYPIASGASVPSFYYIFPVVLALLVAGVFYSFRYTRVILFGISFFAITVFLVLQLLPVGMAIMADRYSYIPSIGIFYLMGEGFYWLYSKKANTAVIPAAISLLVVGVLFFSYLTYERCAVWKNGMTLWNDLITKYEKVPFAYNNRAILHMKAENYEQALNDLNVAIQLQPVYAQALNNRGIIFSKQKRFAEAKQDFDKAIQYRRNYEEAYANRGMMLNDAGRFEEAISDFNKSITLNANPAPSLYNRARAQFALGRKDSACADLQQAINLKFEPARDAYEHLCR